MSLEEEVLREVTPTAAEEVQIARTVAALQETADRALAEERLPGRAVVQGSVAKGTWLRGGADLDLFLLLDPAVPAEALDGVAERVGHRVLESAQKKYAQHPYLVGRFQGHTVDLVPAYAVAQASAKMSAVDRTPFHTVWVRQRLDEAARSEVRLLKRWMKGVGAYGAQTAVGGFSGYLVEVLVARFGSFSAVLGWLAAGARPRRIALGADQVKDDVAPLVVVDPVDPARNCSAAVSVATLELATAAAQAYGAAPERRFFFPAPPRAEPPATLHDALRSQGSAWLGLLLVPKTDRLDIVFPQFQRAARTVADGLVEAGFPVRRLDVAEQDGREVLCQWVTDGAVLPETRLHHGPVDDHRPNAARFREKWSSHPDATGPVRRGADGHLEVALRNRQRTPAEWLSARLPGLAVGKHVEATLPAACLLRDPADVPPLWAPRVADVVLDRKPWQR